MLITNELLVRNLIFVDWNTQNNILVWDMKLKMYGTMVSFKKVKYLKNIIFFRNTAFKYQIQLTWNVLNIECRHMNGSPGILYINS